MKRILKNSCMCAAVIAACVLGGCGSAQRGPLCCGGQHAVALGMRDDGSVMLGAGDALGQAIFANYVTVVRAASPELDAVYASGETTR